MAKGESSMEAFRSWILSVNPFRERHICRNKRGLGFARDRRELLQQQRDLIRGSSTEEFWADLQSVGRNKGASAARQPR